MSSFHQLRNRARVNYNERSAGFGTSLTTPTAACPNNKHRRVTRVTRQFSNNTSNSSSNAAVDHNLFHISRLVTLSGFTSMRTTLTSVILVNYSFSQGVAAAYKGVASCFNPEILYLPPKLLPEAKCHFLNTRISPHLLGLSMEGLSPNVLAAVGALFPKLTQLHLYKMLQPNQKSQKTTKSRKKAIKCAEKSTNKSRKTEENYDISCFENNLTVAQSLCSMLENVVLVQDLTLNSFPYSPALATSLSKLSNLEELHLDRVVADPDAPRAKKATKSRKTKNKKSQGVANEVATNFTENDWILLSKHCKSLKKLDLDGIYGLTTKSLKSLKKNCKNLSYFRVISCDATSYFGWGSDDIKTRVWWQVCNVFGKQLKGLTLWNACDLSVDEMSAKCPNMEQLCLDSLCSSDLTNFHSFENLTNLELLGQRRIYSGDLYQIAHECTKLEEFAYTNEFQGKHTVSHDLMCFISEGAFKNLKKFYTNDDTCSLQMAKLILFEHENLEICCSWNRCNIFSERYKNVLPQWEKTCPCEGDTVELEGLEDVEDFEELEICLERSSYSKARMFLDRCVFSKEGALTGYDLWLPINFIKSVIRTLRHVVQEIETNEHISARDDYEFDGERYNELLDDMMVYPEDEIEALINYIADLQNEMESLDALCELDDVLDQVREWADVLKSIMHSMFEAYTDPPNMTELVPNTMNALKMMKKFKNKKFEKKIDALLKHGKRVTDVSHFKAEEALQLFVDFGKEYKTQKGNFQRKVTKAQKKLFEEMELESKCLFDYLGLERNIVASIDLNKTDRKSRRKRND